MNSRQVFCSDAITWLNESLIPQHSSFVASLPDHSEFGEWTLNQWKEWFVSTAKLILEKTPDDGVTIFYQTDIKVEGTWVDKAYLVQKAAESVGAALLWHRVACRMPAGTVTFGRPSYSHILCFSKKFRVDVAKSTADVMSDIGEKTWVRGMGYEACFVIGKFIKEQVGSTTIIHPFCGEGSMIAMANHLGLDAIGVEKSKKRVEKATRLIVSPRGFEEKINEENPELLSL